MHPAGAVLITIIKVKCMPVKTAVGLPVASSSKNLEIMKYCKLMKCLPVKTALCSPVESF